MKSLVWLGVGVGVGFVLAHQIARTPQGRSFFDDLDRKRHEFQAAVSDGYHAREAELKSAVDEAADTVADLSR